MQDQKGLYILLAAGFSRRFGKPKLLQPLACSMTVIDKSISALCSSGLEFVVALREDDENLIQHLELQDIDVIKVHKAHRGLSSVIAECTSYLNKRDLNYFGICLGDMPYIKPETLSLIDRQASSKSIVRPRYKGKFGHPVLFGRELFPSLSKLQGDGGAKAVIKSFPDKLIAIDVNDPMILHDIDTPHDIIN